MILEGYKISLMLFIGGILLYILGLIQGNPLVYATL